MIVEKKNNEVKDKPRWNAAPKVDHWQKDKAELYSTRNKADSSSHDKIKNVDRGQEKG